jgi:hypothetical protein
MESTGPTVDEAVEALEYGKNRGIGMAQNCWNRWLTKPADEKLERRFREKRYYYLNQLAFPFFPP